MSVFSIDPLLPSLVLAEVVSQNGGFVVPARLHEGLWTGTGLKLPPKPIDQRLQPSQILVQYRVAVLLMDSHWAESYGTSTHVIERFDKPDATDALARTNAFRAEIENPQTALHANARELEAAFLANPAPGDIFSAMPVIAPDLAESTRRRLQEYSPRTRNVLAADAARDAYGLDDAHASRLARRKRS